MLPLSLLLQSPAPPSSVPGTKSSLPSELSELELELAISFIEVDVFNVVMLPQGQNLTVHFWRSKRPLNICWSRIHECVIFKVVQIPG